MKPLSVYNSEEHLSHQKVLLTQPLFAKLVLVSDLVVAELMVLPSTSNAINRVIIVSF